METKFEKSAHKKPMPISRRAVLDVLQNDERSAGERLAVFPDWPRIFGADGDLHMLISCVGLMDEKHITAIPIPAESVTINRELAFNLIRILESPFDTPDETRLRILDKFARTVFNIKSKS